MSNVIKIPLSPEQETRAAYAQMKNRLNHQRYVDELWRKYNDGTYGECFTTKENTYD